MKRCLHTGLHIRELYSFLIYVGPVHLLFYFFHLKHTVLQSINLKILKKGIDVKIVEKKSPKDCQLKRK